MRKFILAAMLLIIVVTPGLVFADNGSTLGTGPPPVSLSLPNPLGTQTFTDLINALTNWLLVITLPIIVLLLLYAGFQFMVSGVAPEQRKNAVNVVKYALIGYAIMLMAKVLVGVITGLFG